MAGRTAAPLAIVGTLCAALTLGIDWYRPTDFTVPGRVLDARLFVVAAVVAGAAGARSSEWRRSASVVAAASMAVAFALGAKQLTLSLVSPTALVVIAAAIAAFGAAASRQPAGSHRRS